MEAAAARFAVGAPLPAISFQRTLLPLLHLMTDARFANSALRESVGSAYTRLATPHLWAALQRCLEALPPGSSVEDRARPEADQEWEPHCWVDVRPRPNVCPCLSPPPAAAAAPAAPDSHSCLPLAA